MPEEVTVLVNIKNHYFKKTVNMCLCVCMYVWKSYQRLLFMVKIIVT